ncbi:MSCRAMM family protein [Qiania dongpingensis]|uniref:Uncharacterized protein n=1 Tax=Qiania dongpingensis TaxID=2763669 RepID=A0A7G9G0Y0_9FIRM|nr:DUF5979 domain-containing protein [Qiania dongpingensis]QNM04462.1 hypothetical protein H9Q78_08155 [Qiania dongpingensis]
MILFFILMYPDMGALSVKAETPGTGSDKSALLSEPAATVSQDGKEIKNRGEIDHKKDINIYISFSFPVVGDLEINRDETDTYISGGDFAVIALPEALELVELKDVPLSFGGTVVGNLTKDDTTDSPRAKIVFTEAVNEESINGAMAGFSMTMRLDAVNDGDDEIVKDIGIYDKTFTVRIPPRATVITGEKSGEADVSNQEISWTIKVNADKEGGASDTDGDLAGYTFMDDLTGVGEYVAGSFRIGEKEDGADAVEKTPVYGADGVLSYTFASGEPEGTSYQGTRYLFFKTLIPDEKYYASGQQKIKNTAEIKDKKDSVSAVLETNVPFTVEWISKEGAVVGEGIGPDGAYDPSERHIEWKIYINGKLNHAVLEDDLPKGLEYVSASAAEYNAGEQGYGQSVQMGTDKVTVTGNPAEGQKISCSMGDISGKKMVTILTKVTDSEITGKKKITFGNTAQIRGTGTDGIKSNPANVTVGVGTIEKSAQNYDQKSHCMDWKVVIDTKKQMLGGGLRVLDLLVYGDKALDFGAIDGIQRGFGEQGSLSYVSGDEIKKLTPQYNQRIQTDSFASSSDLAARVYTLRIGGEAVADLMVVTSGNGGEIGISEASEYTYSTVVCNPNYYAGNGEYRIDNTASLFSYNAEINNSTASKTINSNMLGKDTLDRESASVISAADMEAGSAEAVAAVNSPASGKKSCFDYVDKSVIYRLYVNADELKDVTNDITAIDGKAVGNYKLQDTLPQGWEFKKIKGEDYFLVYEGTGNGGKVNASSLVSDGQELQSVLDVTGPVQSSDDSSGEIMTFEFKSLKKAYVILVKAGPNEETAKGYFSKNGDTAAVNQVKLVDNENITAPTEASADVKIKSSAISKSIKEEFEADEYLKWRIEYTPYDLTYQNVYIKDELPLGLDLRIDSKGNLLIEEGGNINIRIAEMSLRSDGTYEEGNDIPLPDADVLTYDNNSRALTFLPPDAGKAYCLEYVTDITGEGGMNVNNTVLLYLNDITAESTGQKYPISDVAYGALFRRAGWFKINKTDGDTGDFIKGAKFTLYSPEGTVIREAVTNEKGVLYLKALPDGDYILRETGTPAGYASSAKEYAVHVEKDGTGVPHTSIDGEDTEDISIQNFKEGTVGSLLITKAVAGSGGDETAEFDFTITFKDQNDVEMTESFSYVISDGDGNTLKKGSVTGGGTISLSHRQSIKIFDIPKETKYEVTERDYTAEGYITAITGDAAGTIIADTTKTALFTNVKNVGGLTISKAVTGNGGDKEKEFEFTVRFDGPGKEKMYSYTGEGTADGMVKSGDTVKLKHGDSIMIKDIPEGTGYEVQETDYSREGYVTARTGDTGVIKDGITSRADFINTRNTGTLGISKTVEGSAGDKSRQFEFTVTWDGPDKEISFSYRGYGVDGGVIKSGDTIKLAHNQSIVIEGLTEGTAYLVKERDYSEEGYTAAASGDEGKISSNTAVVAHFVNTKQETEEDQTAEGSKPDNTDKGQSLKKPASVPEKGEGKNAVNTGDMTPLLPSAGIVIAAAGLLLIMVFRKKWNKG